MKFAQVQALLLQLAVVRKDIEIKTKKIRKSLKLTDPFGGGGT
jgi:hypothetical protein